MKRIKKKSNNDKDIYVYKSSIKVESNKFVYLCDSKKTHPKLKF